jgi:transaldolase
MKIFLDTANLQEIQQGVRLGVVSGVTTNPSLVAKEGPRSLRASIQEICAAVPGPVSVEVLSQDVPGMLREAREMAPWAPNGVIKLPTTAAGLEATSLLARESIPVNQTLCFSPNQALLAALAGARYVSPFVGRLDDAGHDGMQVVADAVEIFRIHRLPCQVLAASIRHPMHCIAAAKAGAHVASMPFQVLMQMVKHPLTDLGLARFLADWERVMGTKV